MKIDRGWVEAQLRVAEGAERNGYLVCRTAPHRIAALCRLALAVMDAPVAIMGHEGVIYGYSADHDKLAGQRVRLVRVREE